MPKPKRLSDEELGEKAWSYKRHKAHAAAEETLAAAARDAVVAELRARKKMGVPVELADAGLTVTGKDSKRYLDLDRARTTLSRAVLRKVTKTVIVAKLWDAAKKAGEVTDTDDAHCRVETPVEDHIYVNEVKSPAGAQAA